MVPHLDDDQANIDELLLNFFSIIHGLICHFVDFYLIRVNHGPSVVIHVRILGNLSDNPK
jgi:hypothetical protein